MERGEPPYGFRVTASDEFTLLFELDNPDPRFLQDAAFFYPLPRHAIEKYGEAWSRPENLVTNGPFLLESYQPEETITLVRNPHYAGRFNGNLEQVEMVMEFQDGEKLLEMYASDQLDLLFVNLLSGHWLRAFHQHHAGQIILYPWNLVLAFSFNRQPPFDDRRVRQAFALTANQAGLVGESLSWWMQPATGGVIHPDVQGHTAEIALEYDPQRARQLLAEAGYPDGLGFPDLDMYTYQGAEKYGEHLKAQWRQDLNIETDWHYPPWPEFNALYKGNPPFGSIIGWGGPDPNDSIQDDERIIGTDREFVELFKRARRAEDPDERVRIYQELDRRQTQNAYVIPLTYADLPRLVKPWVSKFYMGWYLSLKDAVIEPH